MEGGSSFELRVRVCAGGVILVLLNACELVFQMREPPPPCVLCWRPQALKMGALFAKSQHDSARASTYSAAASAVEATLEAHYDGDPRCSSLLSSSFAQYRSTDVACSAIPYFLTASYVVCCVGGTLESTSCQLSPPRSEHLRSVLACSHESTLR